MHLLCISKKGRMLAHNFFFRHLLRLKFRICIQSISNVDCTWSQSESQTIFLECCYDGLGLLMQLCANLLFNWPQQNNSFSCK